MDPDALARIHPVVVVGGGAAGLATGACLRRRGIEPVIVDRGDAVGESWAARYDRLHLHTPRIQSHLPGYRIPPEMGRWVSRDDMVRYVRAYVAHHRLQVDLGVEVRRIDRSDGEYSLVTTGGQLRASCVVVATGYNQMPHLPDWPGTFAGELVHASMYRRGGDYAGRDVLVVGSGNTGAEIAADLAEQGAARVRLAVRTPPNVIPREIGPVPTTLLGIANDYLPAGLVDPINRLVQQVALGDLTRHGMPPPPEGVVAQMRRTDVVPTIDVGLVDQLRMGAVEIVPAVTGLDGSEVELSDGRRIRPGVIIAATGYRRALEDLVGHLGVLEDGRPAVRGGRASARAPGLCFVGLSNPLKGILLQIRLDARVAARTIARELQGH